MADLAAHYRFREELADRVAADLRGPVRGAEELLAEEPLSAYVTGVLHARRRTRGAVRDDAEAEADDVAPPESRNEDAPDTGISLARTQKPSAMGLTFSVDPTVVDHVRVDIAAARYEPVDDQGRPTVARRVERRSTETDPNRWKRRPLAPRSVTIPLAGPVPELDPIGECLELRVRRRRPDEHGLVALTVSLVNTKVVERVDFLDPFCWFQPHILVTTERAAIVDRTGRRPSGLQDPDLVVGDLLHRFAPSFAVGHGCSVEWPSWIAPPPGEVPAHRARTDSVTTTWVPSREVLLTESNPDFGDVGMTDLASGPTEDVIRKLQALVDAYDRWVVERRTEADTLHGTDFEEAADDRVEDCARAARRMRSGIELLRDDQVMRAFRLANETMAEQRARSAWIRDGRRGRPDRSRASWRPFQIGFVLLCLDGIVDPEHDDRDVADLLWFPTGGGKTEAYLGLIAFTTYLRRLRLDARGGGVTVLMRYTLRLLTLQQFERAAALICAMEVVRRREKDLGDEPVSIGMWVGRAATPNNLQEAKKSLEQLAEGKELQDLNPVQLTSCPWCGTPIDHSDYEVDRNASSLTVRCRDTSCPFADALPVHVVDETIYASRPTLIIATADKFAAMAWRGQVAAIFNRTGAAVGTPPPELIIQDELHLISGPLGTLAGLYEAAVDHAADRPKVIASTATIRRAEDQGRRLFDRDTRQFPPPGLDARDSWFAVEAPPARRATRRYVGVLAPGTSQATLLIRTYSALLHYAASIEGDEAVRDAYWTVVGYFSSLRLLSAAQLQVHADVVERLGQLAERDGGPTRDTDLVQSELTSRLKSSEVPRRLQQLFLALGADEGETVDVALATNMISVGVDIDRLGLMAVMGQPQATAEYIQATSRVGRRDPGLVITMYNAARSRDRSHYESFTPYHAALYRQVESTSVTPFAPRARDRALHAVLIGLLRMTVPIARDNTAAARVDSFVDDVERLVEVVGDRAAALAAHDSSAPSRKDVVDQLHRFVDGWQDLAAQNPALTYEARPTFGRSARNPDEALLRAFAKDDDLGDATDTMWSLRDVDVECPLYLEAR